jgi:hypothetical protein
MAIEKFAVIPQSEAQKPKKDLTSKGVRAFTIWNRGEQVVGGVIGAGALAAGALPLALGAGVWVGWNEAQIRIANGLNNRRGERKAGNEAGPAQEVTVFQRARELYGLGSRKA